MAHYAWAARNGISRLRTGNDSANTGMLHINARLGYEHDYDMVQLIGTV